MKNKTFLKQIRKKIEHDWGKKCKEFCFGCSVCWAHQTLETLESMYEDDYWDEDKPTKLKK